MRNLTRIAEVIAVLFFTLCFVFFVLLALFATVIPIGLLSLLVPNLMDEYINGFEQITD